MKKVLTTLALFGLVSMIGFAISRHIEPGAPVSDAPIPADGGSRLSKLLGSERAEAYPVAGEPRAFRFPEDHGPHQDFRNEWWYFTGNLDDEQGHRFGYELTVFRFSLRPREQAQTGTQPESGWHTNQVYMAHLALTDEENQRFEFEQRFSRGALGLAGARSDPFKVWIEDWSVQHNPESMARPKASEDWQLSAATEGFAVDLHLVAEKPPVLNGIDGLSQKSAEAGNASYYYSIPRMRSTGTLQIAGADHMVSGLSWLDREWGSSALAAGQQGWDWFALQLSDGSDLMFYNIRKKDGKPDDHSAGTWISTEGDVRHLKRKDVLIKVGAWWQSPDGVSYPSRWDIQVPALDLALTVVPIVANQELVTTVRYWEGAVNVHGTRDRLTIDGRGYVELTGYE